MKEAANCGGLANLVSVYSFDPLVGAPRPNAECCVLVALGHWLVLDRPACPLYRPYDPDQQDRADEPGNEVADPSPQVDPKETQNCAGNRRPDDTEHDIHQDPHFTLHELFCQPACNSADDDGCDPA